MSKHSASVFNGSYSESTLITEKTLAALEAILFGDIGDTPAPASIGDAPASIGDAPASIGDAPASIGDAPASIGNTQAAFGDAPASIGDRPAPAPETMAASPNTTGTEASPNTAGAEAPPNTAGAEAPPNTAGAEASPNTAGAEAPPNTAGAEAPPNTAGAGVSPDYIFDCPHCQQPVQVPRNGINCQIFRHGAFKSNPDIQIPPHAPQDVCERLVQEGHIYGCGKPFIFRGGATAEICDYI